MADERNGSNGHDEGFDPEVEPLEEVPPVPGGQVLYSDSKGTDVIVPAGWTPRSTRHKRTNENRKRVLTAIRLGATYRLAAAYAGMSLDTLNDWRRDDEQLEEDIQRASGIAAAHWLNMIEEASKIDWRAAAWKLSHRFPGEYGRNVTEHTGPGGGPLQVREITVRVPQSVEIDDEGGLEEGPPRMLSDGTE